MNFYFSAAHVLSYQIVQSPIDSQKVIYGPPEVEGREVEPLSSSLSSIAARKGSRPCTRDQTREWRKSPEPHLIADYCKVSRKSSDLVYLLSASSRFGLTVGSRSSPKVSLTDFGRNLVYAASAEQEKELKRQAFMSVDLFKRVVEHYRGSQLPEMKYLGNTLQKDFDLKPELHEEFSRLFRENTNYLGIGSDLPGPRNDNEALSTDDQGAMPISIKLNEPKNKKGVCFVIMPFSERTPRHTRGFFSEVLNSLIIPAATDAGFEVRTANRQGTEIIHSTIVNEVIDADIAICDLTEHNPNVLFELGMRLAHEKPVALIHAEGTDRVFDVDNILRVFSYAPTSGAQHWKRTYPNWLGIYWRLGKALENQRHTFARCEGGWGVQSDFNERGLRPFLAVRLQ